jgi:hypothetical protein
VHRKTEFHTGQSVIDKEKNPEMHACAKTYILLHQYFEIRWIMWPAKGSAENEKNKRSVLRSNLTIQSTQTQQQNQH